MTRGFVALTVLVAIGACAWVAFHWVNNPMDARRAELTMTLAALDEGPLAAEEATRADSDELVRQIREKSALWRELVPRPIVPAKPPDLAQLLKGVHVTTDSRGTGNQLKVRIKTPKNRRGAWYGVGDKINGVSILRMTRREVEFGLEQNGTQYIIKLPRSR